MKRQYFVGVLFLGIAACSTPGPNTPESSPNTPESSPDMPVSTAVASTDVVNENTIICKKERPTGSLMRKKLCMTAAEWERIEDGAQDFIYENRTQAAGQQ